MSKLGVKKISILSLILGTILIVSPLTGTTISSYYSVMGRWYYTGEKAGPLHTDGKYIEYANGTHMVLRGVWDGMFADTSTGYFGLSVTQWNESALYETLYKLRVQWGINCINTFIWSDWWLGNKDSTLGGDNQTDIGLRDAIIRTAQVCETYGMYFQVRLYGANRTWGRVEGMPFSPYVSWSVQDFVDFWGNVAGYLKSFPNVVLTLFDEPTGDETTWFNAANQAITAIRNAGFPGLICVHYNYAGDMLWVGDWVKGGYQTSNIIFSEHIYRSGGTFAFNADASTNIEYIRTFMSTIPYVNGMYSGTATKNISDTYNVPIWVSAIGTAYGYSDDNEYVAFRNTLQVLNEFGVGYCVFSATRTATMWTCLKDPTGQVFSPPNRVGQALIDAIAGTIPQPVYTLTVNSIIPGAELIANLTDSTDYTNTHQVPFSQSEFAGNYTVSVPNQLTTYVHYPLQANTVNGLHDFGGITAGQGRSYNFFLYTAGAYQLISGNTTVSTIYLYTYAAGNAEVAIYTAAKNQNYSSYPLNLYYPDTLVVSSGSKACAAQSWNAFSIPPTTLQNESWYFLAMKGDTNNMFSSSQMNWFGDYISTSYGDAFPNSFGTISGGLGCEFSIYIALRPMITSKGTFSNWEDGSTNPVRNINLALNMTLTATYQTTP